MNISEELINWYNNNKRNLPWRESKDPYKIWISEIILQQTRVSQGFPYYMRFIEQFPNLKTLANSSEDKVLRAWQGLGYYSRARNLFTTARYIFFELNNKFPSSYKELISLKGIGDYTAAAIASLAFNEKVPSIDGNVFRVLARLFGIREAIDTPKGKNLFRNRALALMENHPPGEFNQALIEYGALQCNPGQPDCRKCVFESICYAKMEGLISVLPVKGKSQKVRKRYFYYLVIKTKQGYCIMKREKKDIWQSLHEFPLIETKRAISIERLAEQEMWKQWINKPFTIEKISSIKKHQLSHQTLICRFIHISISSPYPSIPDTQFISLKDFHKYAFPVLISRYIEKEIV